MGRESLHLTCLSERTRATAEHRNSFSLHPTAAHRPPALCPPGPPTPPPADPPARRPPPHSAAPALRRPRTPPPPPSAPPALCAPRPRTPPPPHAAPALCAPPRPLRPLYHSRSRSSNVNGGGILRPPLRECQIAPGTLSYLGGTCAPERRSSAHPVGSSRFERQYRGDAALDRPVTATEGMHMGAYDFLVGIDWSTRTHQVCVLNAGGSVLKELAVEHEATAIHGLVEWLRAQSGGHLDHVAVAIEIPRGALVESLLERGLDVFTLNPKQVDRFRDRHSVAGAKDDRRDAYVLADALRTDLHKFRQVALDHPLVIQIREVSRADEDLREDLNRLTNRLREQLHRIAPNLLKLSSAANEPWFWDLTGQTIRRPSRRITGGQAEKLLRKHRIRRFTSEQIMDVLRQEPMHVAPGAAEAACSHIALLLPRLQVAYDQRKQCAKQLAALMEQFSSDDDEDHGPGLNDLKVLRSLPGVGIGVTAALLAEAAPLLAERNYHALRALSGLAPVTKRSGRSKAVQMRYGCNTRLRNAFYHWARTSIQCDEIAMRYYRDLRNRGHSHGRALRSVADRWLRIAMAMLREHTAYEVNHQRRVHPAAA